jgi:ribonuclease PH
MTAVLRAGIVSQAKGSAYLETEKTKILCAVYPLKTQILSLSVRLKDS